MNEQQSRYCALPRLESCSIAGEGRRACQGTHTSGKDFFSRKYQEISTVISVLRSREERQDNSCGGTENKITQHGTATVCRRESKFICISVKYRENRHHYYFRFSFYRHIRQVNDVVLPTHCLLSLTYWNSRTTSCFHVLSAQTTVCNIYYKIVLCVR